MFDFFKKKQPVCDEFNIICPRCFIRMEKEVKGDIILDICKQCGGTWFDKNETDKLFFQMNTQQAKIAELTAPQSKPQAKAPTPKKKKISKSKK